MRKIKGIYDLESKLLNLEGGIIKGSYYRAYYVGY